MIKIDAVFIRSNLVLMNDKNTEIFTEDRFDMANSEDPDEMLKFAAFHLGLGHFILILGLPKYLFNS